MPLQPVVLQGRTQCTQATILNHQIMGISFNYTNMSECQKSQKSTKHQISCNSFIYCILHLIMAKNRLIPCLRPCCCPTTQLTQAWPSCLLQDNSYNYHHEPLRSNCQHVFIYELSIQGKGGQRQFGSSLCPNKDVAKDGDDQAAKGPLHQLDERSHCCYYNQWKQQPHLFVSLNYKKTILGII